MWRGETYLPRCPRGRRLRHGKRRRVLDAPRVKRRLGTSGGRSLLRAGARSATVRQQCRAPRQGAAPWVAGQVGAEFKSWWGSKYGRQKKRTSVTLGTLLSLSSYSSERQNGGEAGAADGTFVDPASSTRQHRIDRLEAAPAYRVARYVVGCAGACRQHGLVNFVCAGSVLSARRSGCEAGTAHRARTSNSTSLPGRDRGEVVDLGPRSGGAGGSPAPFLLRHRGKRHDLVGTSLGLKRREGVGAAATRGVELCVRCV